MAQDNNIQKINVDREYIFTLDKTYAEIKQAMLDGKQVLIKIGGEEYSVECYAQPSISESSEECEVHFAAPMDVFSFYSPNAAITLSLGGQDSSYYTLCLIYGIGNSSGGGAVE